MLRIPDQKLFNSIDMLYAWTLASLVGLTVSPAVYISLHAMQLNELRKQNATCSRSVLVNYIDSFDRVLFPLLTKPHEEDIELHILIWSRSSGTYASANRNKLGSMHASNAGVGVPIPYDIYNFLFFFGKNSTDPLIIVIIS
jgi:hypothetical protein